MDGHGQQPHLGSDVFKLLLVKAEKPEIWQENQKNNNNNPHTGNWPLVRPPICQQIANCSNLQLGWVKANATCNQMRSCVYWISFLMKTLVKVSLTFLLRFVEKCRLSFLSFDDNNGTECNWWLFEFH